MEGGGDKGGAQHSAGGPHVPLTLKVTSGSGPGSGGVSASPPKRSSAGRALPPPGSPPPRPTPSSSAQRTGAGGGGGEAASSTLNWDQQSPGGGGEAQHGARGGGAIWVVGHEGAGGGRVSPASSSRSPAAIALRCFRFRLRCGPTPSVTSSILIINP